MDGKLSTFLRQHPVLASTGLHKDDLAAIGLRSATTMTATLATTAATQPKTTFQFSSQGGRCKASRRRLKEEFLRTYLPLAAPSTLSTTITPAGQSPIPVTHNTNVRPGSATPTPVECAYLDTTFGCTCCRKLWQDHQKGSCTAPVARERVNVPPTSKIGDSVTPPTGFQPTTNSFTPRTTTPLYTAAQPQTTVFRALAIEGEDDHIKREQEWYSGKLESDFLHGTR
ncbi:hypothetical protein JCM11641_002027 [Rhodosporidiobolus odoratus]